MRIENPAQPPMREIVHPLAVLVLAAGVASVAWSDDSSPAPPAMPILAQQTTPQAEPAPAASPPANQVPYTVPQRQTPYQGPAPPRPLTQSSFYISVPLFQDVDREVVRPGASLEGRMGLDLGFLVPEFEVGWAWIPLDLDKIERGLGRDPLRHFFFGLGVRLQVPSESKLTPFVSAAFDLNWWNFRETEYVCDPWYCTSVARFRFTPGFTGRVGFAVEVNPYASIELGLRLGMTFPGDFFTRNEWWVAPMFGFAIRR